MGCLYPVGREVELSASSDVLDSYRLGDLYHDSPGHSSSHYCRNSQFFVGWDSVVGVTTV